ncbi:MAG: putative transcriptional regulator [Actinomycetota bacterium]|jgi:putative transcriptional regulator|nr:putative transcriptional regulator [Actinomycetota bacterium]
MTDRGTGPGLTGRLLVAAPALGDPNFARTVVLLLDHTDDGALGVVINRPTLVEVGSVLPSWQPFTNQPGVLFQGGPVALDSALGLAVVPGDDEPVGWRRVVDHLGLVDLDTPPEILGVDRLRIFAGYAGWGPGQLENEMAEGAWYVVGMQGEDAFTDHPDQLWRDVLRRQGGDLALMSTYPEDPSLN